MGRREKGEKKGTFSILFGSIVAQVSLEDNRRVEWVRQGGGHGDEKGLE